jgi:tetratricopeptide (TPR) repeat protein
MIASADPPQISAEEQEQLLQTVQMFEVIVMASPQDRQSLEILKDAYARLGKVTETVSVAKRLAEIHVEQGQFSQAILEYENILRKDPNDMEAMAAMGEVEEKLARSGQTRAGGAAKGDAVVEIAAEKEDSAIELDFPGSTGTLMATTATQATREPTAVARAERGVPTTFDTDGNEPLARFLIQHKIAPEEIVTSALERVAKRNATRQSGTLGFSLIDEIVRRSSVELEGLLCGILDRSKFAYMPLEFYDVDRSVVKMLPEELALGRLIVPFDIMSRTLMVAVANPFDGVGKEAVQHLLDYNIQWHLSSPAAIHKVLAETYRLSLEGASQPAVRLGA